MSRVIPLDTRKLLPFGSAIEFDNRMLMTCQPTAVEGRGVYHKAIVAMNLDPISSLQGKAPSCYDGIWTDLNVLQMMHGTFDSTDRAFAFHLNTALTPPKLQLKEILPDPPDIYNPLARPTFGQVYDNGIQPVVMYFESPELNCGERDPRVRTYKAIEDGVVFVDCLIGRVDFQAYYKPDQYACWVPWLNWTECALNGNGESLQFRPEMGLGKPDATVCDPATDRPLREGYVFQFKLVVIGHCRVKGAKFRFSVKPDPKFRAPQCLPICTP